jgi:hypothetical protein
MALMSSDPKLLQFSMFLLGPVTWKSHHDSSMLNAGLSNIFPAHLAQHVLDIAVTWGTGVAVQHSDTPSEHTRILFPDGSTNISAVALC